MGSPLSHDSQCWPHNRLLRKQTTEHLSGSGHDLAVRGFEPCIRLCADSSEPGACFRYSVPLSLCTSPCSLCVSLSKINIKEKKTEQVVGKVT